MPEPAKKQQLDNDAENKTPRPELAQLLNWKRNQTLIHWQLVDGSTVVGSIIWFDNYNICVKAENLGDVTIPKHSMLWYKEA